MKSTNFHIASLVKFTFLLVSIFYFTPNSFSQTTVTITTTGTTVWAAPAGVTSVTVEVWAGGGGGGNGDRSGIGSGGAGGGGYSRAIITVTPGTNYNVFVGTGGATGARGLSGIVGQDSWFLNNTTVMAKGGSGGVASAPNTPGSGGTGGLSTAGIGTTKFSGGNGGSGSGTSSTGGGGGSSAGTSANGGNGGTPTAGTAPAGGGNGGAGGNGTNGSPGLTPGGGGGGEGNRTAGGVGAPGRVVLTYTVSPNCPSSTSIAPSAIQNVCQGSAATQLTATITNSGGTGTPTLLYQWYYNTTNSNTIAGATKIAGATLQAYTPLTTVSELGTRYYFSVGYATNNGCTQTDATQSLASNVVQVTVSAPPTTSIAGTNQTICTFTTTLAANNPAIGTGTWTVFSGSATFTNATLYNTTVTNLGSGANILRWTISNGGCTSSQSSVTITNDAPTTPNAGADQFICGTSTTFTGNTISIGLGAWSRISGAGTVTTPSSPTSTVTGLGNGNNVFRWTATRNTCVVFDEVIINSQATTPATPGTITGTVTVPPNKTYVYSVSAVLYATSYTWTVPSGWSITGGQGTTSLTVVSGLNGNNGNITVTASNTCGTSAVRSLAVSVVYVPPHDLCSKCHITHNAPGGTLTSINGNANLCISCHNSVDGLANLKPLSNANKAVLGVSGNSHAWDRAMVNAAAGAVAPTNSEMLLRTPGNQIICSTCHDQHNSSLGSPYLRLGSADALCKTCHTSRNKGKFVTDNVNNRGSHPVGITYPTWLATAGDTLYRPTPINGIKTVSGKVECSSCHATHDVTGSLGITNDGYLLRSTNNVNLCKNCHLHYGPHKGNDCLVCHDVHNTGSQNIFMIRDVIATPNSGNKNVIFTARTGLKSFADGDATYDGICEVCHTTTTHFKNNAVGTPHTGDASVAVKAGGNCAGCHSHKKSFPKPVGGSGATGECGSCHAVNNAPGFPAKIVTGGHAAHNSRSDGLYPLMQNGCAQCHGNGYDTFITANLPAGHATGPMDFNFNNTSSLSNRFNGDVAVGTYNSTAKTCNTIYCHSNGRSANRGTDGTYTWSGTIGPQTPVYTVTPNWTTGKITACTSCHAGKGNMVPNYTDNPPGPGGVSLVTTDYPATGQHQKGGHIGLSQNLSYGGGFAPCAFCHQTTSHPITGPSLGGTYGTSFHVNGTTQFKPTWFSNGGTMQNTWTYTAEGSAGHCGNGKSCW